MDSQEAATPQRANRSFRDAPIDGRALKYLVEAGLTWLRANQQLVNSLNVFPCSRWRYRHEHGADHAIGV